MSTPPPTPAAPGNGPPAPPEGQPPAPPAAPPPAPPAPGTPPPTPGAAPSAPEGGPTEPDTDWKAEARKWETRAKENNAAAARLAELEESQKTEAQKLAERAATAEKEAETAKAEALRYRIATRNGISDEDAETFLTGTSEEALTKQAERLVALRGGQPGSAPAPNQQTPVEHLRPGAMPNPPEPTLADQIASAEKAGKWDEARRLKTQQLMELAEHTQ